MNSSKPKPMPNAAFKSMAWMFAASDLFRQTERLLDDVPLREGMTVVDYGCGPGRFTIPAAKRVGPQGKVYALDIQPLAIKMVRGKASRRSLANVEPILLDSYDTGLPNSIADVVLLIDVIHGIGDRPALLREIHRVLKPGGLLFVVPAHMNFDKAVAILGEGGLFRVTRRRVNALLLNAEAPDHQFA